MVLIHQVAAVSDAGFSRELAALGLGLIGLFTAPAMIFMGLLADRIGRQWSYLLGSVVDGRHLLFDDDQWRGPKLAVSAFPLLSPSVFFSPVALSHHRRRSVSRYVLRRDHRGDRAVYRRERELDPGWVA